MFSFRNFIVLVCTFKLMIYLTIIFCVCCEIMSEANFFPSFEYSLFLVTFIEKSFNSNWIILSSLSKNQLSNTFGLISGDSTLFYFSTFSNFIPIYIVIITVAL